MRKIKFRCWNEDKKLMTYDVIVCGKTIIEKDGNECWFPYPDNEKLIIMQYTGIKDSKGKEIYEGDILTFDDRESQSNFIVKFYDGAFRIKNSGSTLSLLSRYPLKIIGNIYENPELLEYKS